MTLRDYDVEQWLRTAADGLDLPVVSSELLSRTRARFGESRQRVWSRLAMAAVAGLLLLVIVPASILQAQGEPLSVHGIRVVISGMSQEAWLQESFRGWLASPEPAPSLTEEETRAVSPFPIRTPQWLPADYIALAPPVGAFAQVHERGRWRVSEDLDHFFVTQSFYPAGELGDAYVHVMQRLLPGFAETTLRPGTEPLVVASHPAFFEAEVPMAVADEENERRSRRGQLPEIVGTVAQLTVWVKEVDGALTEIVVLGSVPKDDLVSVAESLFIGE